MRVPQPFPRPQAARFVTMAAARLLLLCRKTRALPAEVLRLVHAYIVVHVGWRCPAWVEQLFEDKVIALPRSGPRTRSFRIIFIASATIEYADYRQEENLYDCSPPHAPEPDQPVDVEVKMVTKYKPWKHPYPKTAWVLVCQQGIVCLRIAHGAFNRWGGSVVLDLPTIRRCFTASAPHGSMEVPTTWQDWRRFVQLWLFGPGAQTPMLELRRNPVAGEICTECGKTSAPAAMHPVHVHGKVFCSQWCTWAYMILVCGNCLEPLIDGQGFCRPCLVAMQQAFWPRAA